MKPEILNHFAEKDPVIRDAVVAYNLDIQLSPATPEHYLQKLVQEIIFQQISTKAGQAILARFNAIFPVLPLTAEAILAISHEQLRSVGLSNSKASYIHNIARATTDGTVDLVNVHQKSDEEVVNELVQIKGVGRWTAEMFMLFSLGRENIFSYRDLGLLKGIQKLYGYKSLPKPRTVKSIVRHWAPFSSYGSLVLWRSLDQS